MRYQIILPLFFLLKLSNIVMSTGFRPGIIIHRKITWLLMFSVITLAIAGWLIYVSERNIERTSIGTNQTYEIISRLERITSCLSESELASFRFLEKNDRQAGARLSDIHQDLEKEIDSLQKLTRQTLDMREKVNLLRIQIQEKKALEDSLLPSLGQNPALASLPAARDPSGAGQRLEKDNNAIRALLTSMAQEEKELLTIRRNLNRDAYRKTAYGLIVGRILSFIFVGVLLILLNRDVTRRVRSEERLVEAVHEAQEAKKMQEQFLANMSHEIRTPMNGIKGMTDLLLGTPLSDKQQELAGIIKRSVNNLLVIINDILDFSKIKAGKLNIEKIDFRLEEVLGNVISIFEHRAKKKGLLLRAETDPTVPEWLVGDPHRLYQVLVNIVGNAIKFTGQGQILIKVGLNQKAGDKVTLSFVVADTGIGIPEDSLPFIFDSFSQAGQDISRRYGGTGLGLTICKQLLNLQGGDISVSSRVGNGTTFRFHLPYLYKDRPENHHIAAPAMADFANILSGKRFLVVEDNEINQKLIDHVLKNAGGSVELASNGNEAIRYLQSGHRFDLIIMDLQMPEMDGYAATQYIRKDLHMKTPIIAMTATALKGEQLQCMESGMNEYMTKPFEFEDLYKRIGTLLS
jgi:signal transduction histidine kinase